MMKARTIALLTDFGQLDPFVGMMKGVIIGLFPSARLIDLSHEIPPGDILRAAVTLWQAVPYFPAGTVFLAVIDPGVGSDRRPVIMRTGGNVFIGPDNGIFSFILRNQFEANEITNFLWKQFEVSATFHGRDIFAPAAALACAGEPPASFGLKVSNLVRLPVPHLNRPSAREMTGEILFPDHFGNLLTSLGKFRILEDKLEYTPWIGHRAQSTRLGGWPQLVLPDTEELRLVRTFSDLPEGECGGIIGSSGLLEIAANRASAAEILKLGRGDRIKLRF